MLGFRQDLGFAGSVQSVAAVAVHPETDGTGSEALDEAAIRTWETMHLGDEIEAEVGSNQVLARFGGNSPRVVAAALPFASVGWRDGDSIVRYRMSTILPGTQSAQLTPPSTIQLARQPSPAIDGTTTPVNTMPMPTPE